HHRVLLVDDRRDSLERSCQHRRQRRIAAESDHHRGLDTADQAYCLRHAEAEARRRASECQWIASAQRLAGDEMDVLCRKVPAVATAPMVADKVDDDAAAAELLGKRLRWKQMSASSARGEQHERRVHQAGLPAAASSRRLANNSARGRSRVKANNIPIPKASEIIDEPPYEMNRSVMPLAGIKCKFTPMLMAHCSPNKMARPAPAKRANGSSLRMARRSTRNTIKANSATSTRQSTMPNPSAATANTKSVWLSGRMRLTVPSPGPRPNQPPRWNDSSAWSMLKVSPEDGSRNRSMRRATWGMSMYAVASPVAAAPPSPTTQTRRMPARKNSALHTSATSMVCPKSGCNTSPATATESSASAKVFAGISGRRADSPNSQAMRMTNAGLRNSEG